jgi:hypothetical protein
MNRGSFPHLFTQPINQEKSLPAWYQTLLDQIPSDWGKSRSPLERVLLSEDNRQWINDAVFVALKVKTGKDMNVTGNSQNAAVLENLLNDAYTSHAIEPPVGTSPTSYHQAIRDEILRLNVLIVDTLVEAVVFDLTKPKHQVYNVMPLPERDFKDEKNKAWRD